jgi:hypothetical protein
MDVIQFDHHHVVMLGPIMEAEFLLVLLQELMAVLFKTETQVQEGDQQNQTA